MLTRKLLRLTPLSKLCKRCSHCQPEPVPQITVLNNGVQVITETTNSPLLGITLLAEAGPRFETTCCNGIAHFIEHLAYKGFIGMGKREIEEFALQAGAKFTAKTTQELQSFSVTCPVEAAENATEILCKTVTDLALDECEILRERYNIALELEDLDRDPKALVFENLIRSAFQGTSLGQPVIGPTSNLERFDQYMVWQYLKSHYQPWRLVVATSGCIPHVNNLDYIQRTLAHVQPTCCSQDLGACRYSGSSIIYRDDSQPYAHVCVAFEAPGYTSPDYIPMLVLKNIVGKWNKAQFAPGSWPELAKRCSDTELCESYESFYITYRDVGLWGVYFVAKTLEVDDFLHNAQNVWMHLCTTTVLSDVERAKNVTKLELCSKRLGSFRSSLHLAIDAMYRCHKPNITELDELLSRVQVQTVHKLGDTYLYDRCPVVSAVGPTEGLPEYNRIRSNMYWLRL